MKKFEDEVVKFNSLKTTYDKLLEKFKVESPSTVNKPSRLECSFTKDEISKLDKTFFSMEQCIQEAV